MKTLQSSTVNSFLLGFGPQLCKGKPTIKTGCKTRENSSTECHKSPERRNSSSSVRANTQCRCNGRGFCSLFCRVSPRVSQHRRAALHGSQSQGGLGTALHLPGDRQGAAFQINTCSYKLLLRCMAMPRSPPRVGVFRPGLRSEWGGWDKMLNLYPYNLCSKQRGKAVK